jgi:hypothetical protein
MRFGGEDAVLFNKMLMFGAIANISEPLLYYRLTPTSMSQKSREFNKLLRIRVSQEVYGECICEDEKQALALAYKHPSGGDFGYYLYVGKLFLMHKKSAARARHYLLEALKRNMLSIHVWLCLFSSFIPLSWRDALRQVTRNKKG